MLHNKIRKSASVFPFLLLTITVLYSFVIYHELMKEKRDSASDIIFQHRDEETIQCSSAVLTFQADPLKGKIHEPGFMWDWMP
jgi:heme/copper-type cytochrome/quinol oxidase subunit 2